MNKSNIEALLTTLFFTIFVFLNCCWAQEITAQIDDIIHKYVNSGDIHGTVLVAEKGNILYSGAYGLANMEWEIPHTVDTRFRIYSMSKQFTAMLIMQLVEAGKLDLQKPISEYLPYYRKDVGMQVRIHHLLTHTHGIAEGYEQLPPFLITEPTRILVEKYFSNDLDFQPGTKFRYSDLLGYTLLGAIIESVTGKSYSQVLQSKILEPAGMRNTTYLDYRGLIKNRADDYVRTEQGFEHRIQAYPVNADGASCLVSTMGDLLLWDQALYSNTLLSERYQKELFTPHVTHYSPYYYGYGWYIADLNINGETRRIFYHTGGGTCIIIRSVHHTQTVIILNNIRSDKLYDIGIEILTQINIKG
ncbi:MAG: beta-lactamase family protein [bacterium]|nr:MAG: beta-lactamase family protein [bacterium]